MRGNSRGRFSHSVSRPKPTKSPDKTILIVCEGKKTEPNYFYAIKQERRLSTANVEIVDGSTSGTDPLSIVKYAAEFVKDMAVDGRRYDEVWCVFDRDDHDETRFKMALDVARRKKINIALSNPSFELWVLLHFADQTSFIARKKALHLVKASIPNYRKGMDGLYGLLRENTEKAIARAISLRKMHVRNLNDEKTNPSTAIDKVVSVLVALKGTG